MFGIAACSKYQRDISPFRRRVTFGMAQKSPKGHRGFAQGKHFAMARVFIRRTPEPPFYGERPTLIGAHNRRGCHQEGYSNHIACTLDAAKIGFSGDYSITPRCLSRARLRVTTRRPPRLSIPRRFLHCGAAAGRFLSRASKR